MPPSELRKEAREVLKGKWGKAVCIVLAFLAVSMVVGFIQGFLEEGSLIYKLIELALFIIEIPLSFGLLITFTKFKRNEEVHAFDFIKEGFSRFVKAWGIWFHTFIRVLLPIICLVLVYLLLILLGIVNNISNSNLVLTILGIALFIATIIYVASRVLLYVIAYNISYDNPNLSSKECVKQSELFMKGNRGNYFMLELSFIGWAILSLFTLGIGMLWLMPYMQVATICFYERVSKLETAEKIEE